MLIKVKRFCAVLTDKNTLPKLLTRKMIHLAVRELDFVFGTKKVMPSDCCKETRVRCEELDFMPHEEEFLSGLKNTCRGFDLVF